MHPNPKLEVKRCANPRMGEAVERCKTTSPSVVGRGGHTIGATADNQRK